MGEQQRDRQAVRDEGVDCLADDVQAAGHGRTPGQLGERVVVGEVATAAAGDDGQPVDTRQPAHGFHPRWHLLWSSWLLRRRGRR